MRLVQQQTTNDEPIAVVHESSVGTYHADPKADVAWTVNDTRGTIDGGPDCDNCGSCDDGDLHDKFETDGFECRGLSFAFVCLDGGESLCKTCAEGVVEIVPCTCEGGN